jgi:predicted ATPase
MKPSNQVFVGRFEELNLLIDHSLNEADDGGWVDVISGEPGIGKSALPSELSDRLDETGIRIHTGRCIEGIAPPNWPWIEIVRSVAASVDIDAFTRSAYVRFDALDTFVPGVIPRDAVINAAGMPLRLEQDSGKFYLFQAILELFRFAAAA